jgi:hypothetical protein
VKNVTDWDDGKKEEDCNCEECPEKLKDLCVDPKSDPDVPGIVIDNCWNGEIDPWETCEECPEDFWGCVKGGECNTCPCEYVDFATNLTRWDTIRAKLWDKPRFVFYNYSNSVAVENYLDIK